MIFKIKGGLYGGYRFEGFGHSSGVGEKIAVIVVDFMKGFTDEKCPFGSNLDREVKATRELLDAARESGAPVITISAWSFV